MNDQGHSPPPRRILIASSSVGAGHNQAAQAIGAALRSAFSRAPRPDQAPEVDIVDTLAYATRPFRAFYAGGYALLVSRLPRLYGLGYWLKNRPQGPRRSLGERRRLWQERQSLRRFGRYVLDARPDLIVNTHFLSSPYITHLVRSGRLETRQMVVVTDIREHRYWFSEGVEHWFVAAERTGRALQRWGIPPQQITVSGIPIHPKWTAPLDRQKVLAEWRLPSDRPIVLLSGGAEFTCGPVVQIARQIRQGCPQAFVAVLGGRNKKLLAALSRLPEAGRDFVGIAFTDRVHELVEVCCLMVTKAGGLTTAECLAKGTPMVLLKPVPGQEAGNAAYFAAEGAAVLAQDPADVVAHVSRLLNDTGGLARMGDNARRLHRPAAQTIAEAVCRAVGLTPPP